MTHRIWFLLTTLILTAELSAQQSNEATPPVAPIQNVSDSYYGTTIVDPYRYMEDFKTPPVQSWLKAQDTFARTVLLNIPARDTVLKRIVELSRDVGPGEITNVHRRPNGFYIYLKRLPDEGVARLYMRQGESGPERLLLDPKNIKVSSENAKRGASTIAFYSTSSDLKYLAVTIVCGGAEVDAEVHVIEVSSGRETGDVIAQAFANAAWLPDNRSFMCSHLRKLPPGAPAAEIYRKVRSYLHVLGTDPSQDSAVFGDGVVSSIPVDPDNNAFVLSRPGSNYVVGVIQTGVTPATEFYIAKAAEIGSPNIIWRKIAAFSDEVSEIALHGDEVYALSFKDSPRYKLVKTDARNPNIASAEVLVPESKAVLQGLGVARDAVYVETMNGGVGQILRIEFGDKGNSHSIDSRPGEQLHLADSNLQIDGILAITSSWIKASSIAVYDPKTEHLSDTGLRPSGKYDAPEKLTVEELLVPSHDGTLVPLSLIHPKNLTRDGTNPTLLSGYGAYGISQDPAFDKTFLAWYERGGISAVCHVRGGGEFGEAWHLAGKESTKPNTWRDFIACGEYLVQHKYTSPARLAIQGGSAGGILIGRALTERPDLWAAAMIDVGASDMLRFETTANGAGNVAEFGNTKTKAGFDALYAMSPYHHIRDHTPYPAILLTTGINDSRIDPWQVAKMAARLQAASSSGKPILLRIDFAGGHAGSTADEREQDVADMCSFLLWQLGVPGFQPKK
jgi:prolyl oligopeptidase